MRLFLSSHRLGRHADALVRLVGNRRNALVIGNALDYIPAAARAVYTATTYDPVAELNTLGLPASWLDLRDFVGSPIRLHDQLSTCGLVWVLGGNSFVPRQSGGRPRSALADGQCHAICGATGRSGNHGGRGRGHFAGLASDAGLD